MCLEGVLYCSGTRMSRTAIFLFACFVVAVAGGCGEGIPEPTSNEGPSDTAIDNVVQPLPGLPAGSHLGAWITYDVLPPGIAAAADARLAEVRTAGSKISRVHVAWSDLEPNNGTFDLVPLRAALARVPDGDAIMVLIETIDTGGFSLPSDLVGADGGYALAPGRRFGDAIINQRFAALLQRVIPVLRAHRVFALSVGNEPDTFFDGVDPSSSEGLAWQENMVAFLSAARTIIRSALPDVAVALTLDQRSVEKGRAASLLPMLRAGDVASFNYYCQDQDLLVQRANVVASEVDQLVALSGNLPIVFQEVGCPAGASSSRISGSEQAQVEFITAVGHELATRPQLRAAFWFQLVDWSPELAATFGGAIAAEGHPELGARFEETLATIGLVRYSDGATRPAWPVFLDMVRNLRE